MSCRSGVGAVRGGTSGLQPMRATVPFQLNNKTQPGPRDGRTAERTKPCAPKPNIRRTLSLDTVVGPYLQGQWPKELDTEGICSMSDKATQTPSSWPEEAQVRRAGSGHKRSASWSSAEHRRELAKLKQHLQQRFKRGGRERDQAPWLGGSSAGTSQTTPITIPLAPLVRLAPRLRHSIEGLNQELEGVFVREQPEEQHRILDVPDGHRAPVPSQRCSSGSQSDPSPALLSPSPSPCSSLSPFPLGDMASDSDVDALGYRTLSRSPPFPLGGAADPSFLQLSSSPRPNKSYSFQREPPEGCERVRVSEDGLVACMADRSFPSSCPDPNKVNFTPHGGSAFCPVSLLKPLLPSVDFLFRSLSVSPVAGCSSQGSAPYQVTGPGVAGYLGLHADTAATTAM
ncbi:protein FAM117A-like [Paramormyrops kingsleyae]|uniref:protein FAM117A-like n=1 Tax=Paramormyrops kingsleyae TaxID=1676925 RepID=UPI003B97907A